ncbi:hypothetical protein [Geothrix campi]|uniref:hypothetical protein n=1 Tax=Geothrix campi TaxID=2966450 RepID=UPI002147E3D0|nr:hypothetical protein [Geothrix sp. SG10]
MYQTDDWSSEVRAIWGFGSIIAVTISWGINKSILWAMLHGVLSWLYVTYYALRRLGPM